MKRRTLVLGLGLVIAVSGPAIAQKPYDWKVLAAAAWVTPLSDDTDGGVTTEATDSVGWEIGLEWRMSELLGFELDYLDVSQDVEEGGQKVAEVDMNPVSLSVNFHLIRRERIDVWVAPTVSSIYWDSDQANNLDDEFTYGASAGIDFAVGEKFALTAGLRWLDATVEGSGSKLSVDPLFLRAGVAYRF